MQQEYINEQQEPINAHRVRQAVSRACINAHRMRRSVSRACITVHSLYINV